MLKRPPSICVVPDAQAAMLGKLAQSGLTEQDAKALGMVPCVNGTTYELTGYNATGFKIPYYDVDGKETEFFRFRFLGEPAPKHKYTQPTGTGIHVYFPDVVVDGKTWADRAKDPKEVFGITEGELKSASACKHGFPTIGLGGVSSVGDKRKHEFLCDDLAQIEWNGRKVYIIFDDDATTKHQVMKAENALAKKLLDKGASPYIVRLPSLNAEGKTGLDDFLMNAEKGGPKRYARLLNTAEEWAASKELRAFNDEVVLVHNPPVIIIRATKQIISPECMSKVLFANRIYRKSSPTEADPQRMVDASVPVEWLKWPGRLEAKSIVYLPGVEDDLTENGDFNMWKGLVTTPVKGSVKPWHKLLDFVFKDNLTAHRHWFEQWCAYMLRHPGVKMYSAPVFWSLEQGVGKTLIGYTLGRIFGDGDNPKKIENYIEIHDQDLENNFNSFAVFKQLVLCDEITGPGTTEKKRLANKAKGLITRKSMLVSEKYVKEYTTPDVANYMFNSNHCDAMFLEKKDRRYFVVEIKGMLEDKKWFKRVYDPWYKSEAGINAFHYYLLHYVDMKGFDPLGHAPMTEAKQEMIEASRSDISMWLHSLSDELLGAKDTVHALMTLDEMLAVAQSMNKLQHTTAKALSIVLKQEGFVQPLKGTQLLLEGSKTPRVRPWLIDKSVKVPRYVCQADMRDLWYSDRPAEMPSATKKFIPKEKKR